MSCLPELTYSIYADGELPADEARQVETHLAACPRCRALVEALRGENRLLTAALEEQEALTLAPTRLRDVVWTALAVFAGAAGLQTAFSWVSETRPALPVDWLNPFSLSGQVNVFFSTVFYFVQEGAAMLASSLTTISALVFGLLIFGAVVVVLRRRLAALALLVTLALGLGLALPGTALEKRKGDTITIAQGETLDDNLMAKGETITIDGVITGNLITFGKAVAINGTVQGDVISFSQTLDVNGTVEGNVFSFSQWLNIRGRVNKSSYNFVQNGHFDANAEIGGDLLTFVDQASLDASVGRDATIYGAAVDVRGAVGRTLTASCGRFNLLAPARVGGDVEVYPQHKGKGVKIDPQATVVGKVNTHEPTRRASRYVRAGFYWGQALRVLAAFVTGLLLFWLFPALVPRGSRTVGSYAAGAGVGFLALVALPIAAIVTAITLIGLPIAVLTLMTWVAGLYMAKLFVAILIGQAVLRPANGKFSALALTLLVGLLVIYVAANLPYLGGWIKFLVVLLGLGIAAQQLYTTWRAPKTQPAA